MKHYWYYTYKGLLCFGCGRVSSNSEDFEIVEVHKYLRENFGKDVIVTNWKEVSKNQYEKMEEYFENQPK